MILWFSIAILYQKSMEIITIMLIMMRIFIMLMTISMLEIQLDSLKFALTIGISRAWCIRIADRNQNLNFLSKFSEFSSDFFSTISNPDQYDDGRPFYNCNTIYTYNCNWDVYEILASAVPSPDGYVTLLNCPICGCTPGQNDVVPLNERS